MGSDRIHNKKRIKQLFKMEMEKRKTLKKENDLKHKIYILHRQRHNKRTMDRVQSGREWTDGVGMRVWNGGRWKWGGDLMPDAVDQWEKEVVTNHRIGA